MSTNRTRVFEGTHVPLIFEEALIPQGADPDGLGPLTKEDLRLSIEFEMVCKKRGAWYPQLKRLSKEVFNHQKYRLKNSHSIAAPNGEQADYMDIEDICPPLAKIGCLNPVNPDYVFDEDDPDSRYEIPPWIYEASAKQGTPPDLIAAVRHWDDEDAAFELTPYPGDRAIDGDGNYPIFLPPEPDEDFIRELENLQLPADFQDSLAIPKRTQCKSFTDHQWQKGFCPNKAGRPRSLREVEDIDDRRPHFFDILMPPDTFGKGMSYGLAIYRLSCRFATDAKDFDWLAQMDEWAKQLARIRSKRKKFVNGGYVYSERLDVTRIDIAIRHLGLVDILWRKSPSARWMIKPWLVSEALERMNASQLARTEMEGIYVRTRTPQHVDWPDWWPDDLRCKLNKNDKLVRPRRKISGTLFRP